jgi:DNA-binding NarL/FixJ family response regulator
MPDTLPLAGSLRVHSMADSSRRTSRNAKARLLIVDDHPIVRQGLAQLIDRQSDLCVESEAEAAEEGLQMIRDGAFDMVIVDLSLRGLSGLELIKQIKTEFPELPVLVLSMHDELFYAERALRAGAKGYIMKQEAIEKVIEAIRKVLRGEVYVSKEVSDKLLYKFISGEPGENVSPVERLSDRELEVFQLVGQGYGTRQVAEMLHLSIKTVESYRANIKDKLRLKNAAELMQHAVQWVQSSNKGKPLS